MPPRSRLTSYGARIGHVRSRARAGRIRIERACLPGTGAPASHGDRAPAKPSTGAVRTDRPARLLGPIPACGGSLRLTGDRPTRTPRRPRAVPARPNGAAAPRRSSSTRSSPPMRPGARRSRRSSGCAPSRRPSASRSRRGRRRAGRRCSTGRRSCRRSGQGGRGGAGPRPRRRSPTVVMQLPNLAPPEAPAGGEDDYVVLEHIGDAARLRRRGLRAARPRRARPAARRDRHRARREGRPAPASTTSPASAPSSSWPSSTWRWTRPRAAGFTPMIPPALVKPRAMEGTGFLGQAADDVYHLEGDDLYLVGTSEVPLAAYHSDEILDADSLPLRYAAFSPCYRREAGSYGKDTRGHHPGALVRQGGDVHLHDRRGVVRRAPAAARAGRRSG